MKEFLKSHWDVWASVSGLLATITVAKFNVFVACLIGLATLVFVSSKAFIWVLKARLAWKNRDSTRFFEKVKDEETET